MNPERASRLGPALVLCGVAGTLLWLERRQPLRNAADPGLRRLARNLCVGVVTAATVSAIERPLVSSLSRITGERGWGLVERLPLPAGAKTSLAVIFMDYTLYWWHVLLHRVPALWRAHQAHHSDRDLDTSTGIRFHFLEFIASVPWRCAQIVIIGVGPQALSLWQKLTLLEVLFHHSNVRLPRTVEHWLSRIVVTPRQHGIHHSVVLAERDSNFSSGFSIWDRLHGTAHASLHRDHVTIGLPDHARSQDVTLARTLALPFERRRSER